MKLKKLLASILCIAMVLSTMGFTVFADEPYPTENWIDDANTDWYTGDQKTYVIKTAEELAGLAKLVNNGEAFVTKDFNDITVMLGDNISLSEKQWTPIGNLGGDKSKDNGYYSFTGIFDGNEKIVSDLCIYSENTTGLKYANFGLFGSAGSYDETRKTTIKYLTVNNATVVCLDDQSQLGSSIGIVAGNANANITIDNVHVTGDIYLKGWSFIGGIVGHGYPSMTNCSVKATGSIITNQWCNGGLIGYLGEGPDVSDCVVEGQGEKGITLKSAMAGVGGAVGRTNGGNKIERVYVSGINIETPTYYAENYGAGYVASGVDTPEDSCFAENVTIKGDNDEVLTPDDATSIKVIRAYVEDTPYETLEEAVSAAQGTDTIRLVSDVTVNTKMYLKDQVTLDLNGKTLNTSKTIYADGGALVNIISSADKKGVINYTEPYEALYVRGAINKIENIKIDGNNVASYGVYVYGQGRYVNEIKNCEIVNVKNGLGTYKVNNTTNYPAFGLIEGTVIDASDIGIFFFRGGICNEINESTIKGGRLGIAFWGHSADCGYYQIVNANNSTIEGTTGTAIEMKAEWASGPVISYKANISNCELIGGQGAAYVDKTAVADAGNAFYAEGTNVICFAENDNTKIYYTEIPETYDGVLYGMVAVVDGTEYLTIQEAINATNGNGTVTLIRDAKESAIVKNYEVEVLADDDETGVTIDLDGFTLTGNIFVEEGAVANIKNGTIINTNKGVSAIETHGTTTLTNLDVTSARHAVRVEGGRTTINGGEYKLNNEYNQSIYALNVSDAAVVDVLDGTFVGDGGINEATAAVKSRDTAVVTIHNGKYSIGVYNTLVGDSANNIVVKGGMFDQDPAAYVAEDFEVIETENAQYPYAVAPKTASKVKVVFDSNDDNDKDASLYNIKLVSIDGYAINEFVGAELTFENTSTTAANEHMQYEILGIPGKTDVDVNYEKEFDTDKNLPTTYAIRLVDNALNDGVNDEMTGTELVIGQVKFIGQGTINFEVTEGTVAATQYGKTLERYYIANGDALTEDTLVLDESKITNGAIAEAVGTVVVNVAYNHILNGKYWKDSEGNAANQMTVTLKDAFGNVTDAMDISDGNETFTNVKVGKIIVTLEAPGFRKYVYQTNLENAGDILVLDFWNEVKRGTAQSPLAEIEAGKGKIDKNFLAGDIVMDYIVDEYDLAAVTSYYGTYDLTDAEKFIKYDLNRDGNIDIIDVAYVLHSYAE